MNIIINGFVFILIIILALCNLLAYINHCRNSEKIKELKTELEVTNEKFNDIGVDISVNDNDIRNIKEFIGYKDPFDRMQFANHYATVIKRFFNSNQWTNEDFETFTSIPISADILDTGIESYIEDAINKALQVSEKILKPYSEEYYRRLEHPDPVVTRTQAETLPEGWIWVETSYEDDFDIRLNNQAGDHYFIYDIMTGEYKLTSDSDWAFFLNENYETGKYERASLSEFKAFAEKYVNESILNKE